MQHEHLHSAHEVCDGFCDRIIARFGVVLAAFVQQLHELSREPSTQAVQLSDPAMLVAHAYDCDDIVLSESQLVVVMSLEVQKCFRAPASITSHLKSETAI